MGLLVAVLTQVTDTFAQLGYIVGFCRKCVTAQEYLELVSRTREKNRDIIIPRESVE